jgi:hypothetical protein
MAMDPIIIATIMITKGVTGPQTNVTIMEVIVDVKTQPVL